jgi:GNAT superfamily N-acetyltransferase
LENVTLSAPEPLTAAHDVSAFDCGIPALDDWLKNRALANQAMGASRTYVVCRGETVVGYFALAAGSVAHAPGPGRVKRNMPDPIPMMILGRLAVDRSAQGQGLGYSLLKDAVQRVVQAADIVGVRGILVDAIDDNARSFYEKFGFRRSTAFPLKLMMTVDEAQRALAGGSARI